MNNVIKKGTNILKLPDNEIISLYLSGTSQKQLSIRFNVSRSSILKRLIDAGIDIRGIKSANTLRSSQYTTQEKIKMTMAAHIAARGRKVSWQTKCLHANTIQNKPSNVSAEEIKLSKFLKQRNIDYIPQQAIGGYNCDIGAYPIAVEVFGGEWHFHGRHADRLRERIKYILNSGWSIYIIIGKITSIVANNCVSYIEHVRGQKSSVREYRVIRSTGKLLATGRLDGDHLSFVPSLRCPPYINRWGDKYIAG